MNRNEQITALCEEILRDITRGRIPLHNILLKALQLSLFLDNPKNVDLFKEWAKRSEGFEFIIGSFRANVDSAKDSDMTGGSNTTFTYSIPGNSMERSSIRSNAETAQQNLAHFRAETFKYVMGVLTKWQFGNMAESIFEKKRSRTETTLQEVFPDIQQRLNTIEQNLRSDNPEGWRTAAAACRTLLIDLADALNPSKGGKDNQNYINRLQEFVSPRSTGATKAKVIKGFLDELKARIEFTSDATQGPAHAVKPSQDDAEDVVVYTYLLVSDLMKIKANRLDPINPETAIDESVPHTSATVVEQKGDETPATPSTPPPPPDDPGRLKPA